MCLDVKRHSQWTEITATFWTLHKGKAVPLQAWIGPEGSRKLRFPDFVTRHRMVVRLSVLRIGRLYPQEIPLAIISVRGWVDPRPIVRSEGFYVNEKSTAGIEPATFRIVAQHVNHCATAVPHYELCIAEQSLEKRISFVCGGKNRVSMSCH